MMVIHVLVLAGVLSNFLAVSIVICGKSGNKVLVGKNMDRTQPGGRIWFIPEKQGAYGAIYFGIEEDDPRSGFNSEGLFCTIVESPYWQVNTDPGKEVLFGNLVLNKL